MSENIKFLTTKDVATALGCSLPTARNIMMRQIFRYLELAKTSR